MNLFSKHPLIPVLVIILSVYNHPSYSEEIKSVGEYCFELNRTQPVKKEFLLLSIFEVSEDSFAIFGKVKVAQSSPRTGVPINFPTAELDPSNYFPISGSAIIKNSSQIVFTLKTSVLEKVFSKVYLLTLDLDKDNFLNGKFEIAINELPNLGNSLISDYRKFYAHPYVNIHGSVILKETCPNFKD